MSNLFTPDPSSEKNNYVLKGCQHKYKQTLVVITTNKCFNYCSHCFRRRIFNNIEEVCVDYSAVREYINDHSEITNVLLTGGDPLILSNVYLERIITRYIPKGVKIRLGTRAVTYKPERFNKTLVSLLRSYRVDLQLHINNPLEYDKNIIETLKRNRIVLRSQTVLLKEINDNVQTLENLFKTLVKDGIVPYYLFQNRPVLTEFSVPLRRAILLVNKVRRRLSGPEKLFNFCMSNSKGKIEIVGIQNGNFVFRYHQAKDERLENKTFLVPIDNERIWLDKE